jgi:uncharacterized membrane protein
MNGAEPHLLVNHLPVIIPLVGLPLIAFGLLAGVPTIQKVGLWVLGVGALLAVPAYLSGEPAEVVVKNYPGISRLVIHTHERAAKLSMILMLVTAAAALLFLLSFRLKKKLPFPVWGILLILGTVSFVHIANTAHLGGLIRHEEISGRQ